MTGLRGGVNAPGPVAASNAAAKTPAPDGIKGLIKGTRSPAGLIRVEAAGKVLTAVFGVDPEKMPAAAGGEADGELAELSKAWKETL